MAEKKQKELVVLAGKAYFAFVHAPQKDDKYGDKYKVDLVIEDEDGTPYVYKNPVTGQEVNMVDFANTMHAQIKTTEKIPGRFISVRSKAEYMIKNKETGKKEIVERAPIPVTFADKTPLTSETLIGNGSKVRVQASVSKWIDDQGVEVTTLYLERMIVDELVPYSANVGGSEFDFPHLRKKKEPTDDSM